MCRLLLAARLTEEAHFHLNQFFQFAQHAAARYEKDDMVAVLQDLAVVAPHNDFVAAHDGGNVAAGRPFHFIDTPTDQRGRVPVAVYHRFDGFRRAAPQRIDRRAAHATKRCRW